MSVNSVLFVCTGNICRSPTAEGILLKRVAQLGLKLKVDSAGTHGYHSGEAPDVRSIRAAEKRGYDLAKLKARRLSSDDYVNFDLLVALDHDHMAIMQRQCPPEHQHKLVNMMDYASTPTYTEVPDPYYGSPAGFELVLDLLEDAVTGLLQRVQREG